MYPLGTSCANLSGAVYKTSYDAWGNATSRTYSSNSTTQSFDLLNHLVKWNLGTSQKAWYAYDAGGERTIQRTTNGSTTTMTVYAFGSEEYQYDGSGNLQSSTHYYALGGRLIGELTGNGTLSTSLFLTDELGSVLATFSNTQGNAAVQGTQTYGPYGSQQYQQGSMNTAKGYTGQYADPLTGFDYDNARYYDPVAGVFLSADSVQGNASGLNPYAYVGGNPETASDPTGHDAYYDNIVETWYIGLEAAQGNFVLSQVDIPNAKIPDLSSNTLPALEAWEKSLAQLAKQGGIPSTTGRPDLMNFSLKLIYDIKSGGDALGDGSVPQPSLFTVQKGWSQVRYYAAMANRDPQFGGGWRPGSLTHDKPLAQTFQSCGLPGGNSCMITLPAKGGGAADVLITYAGSGILTYSVAKQGDPQSVRAYQQNYQRYAQRVGSFWYALIASTVIAAAAAGANAWRGGNNVGDSGGDGGAGMPGPAGKSCSFTFGTTVWTPQGEEAIGLLHVGSIVLSYSPTSHVIETEPVVHVWKHMDDDLVDVIIIETISSQISGVVSTREDIIHTTSKHPFLTQEAGFVPISQLKVGMHVLQANGNVGVVAKIQIMQGSSVMYNLEVANDHNFTVGDGQWIVHNSCMIA